MNDRPLISIIIPVYNVKQFLGDCLDSILKQKFHNYEILLIDDGSTDGSTEICKNYCSQSDKVIFIRQENKGVGEARNNGIRNAKGDFIYFLDSDDFIEDDFFAAIVPLLKNDTEIVHFGFNRVNIEKTILNKQVPKKGTINNLPLEKAKLASLLNSGVSLSLWNKLIKTSLIKENNIWFDGKKRGQDIAFNIKVFNVTKRIDIIDKSLINYRIIMGTGKKNDPSIVKNHIDNFIGLHSFFKGDHSSEIEKYLNNLFSSWFLFVIPLNISSYNKESQKKQIDILFNNEFIISYLKKFRSKLNPYQKIMAFSILNKQVRLFVLFGKMTSTYRKFKYS